MNLDLILRIRNDLIILANRNPNAWAWFADRRGEEILFNQTVEFLNKIREEMFYILHNDGRDDAVIALFAITKIRFLIEKEEEYAR